MKWTMRTGEQIEISDMDDSHLANTIAMLRRKGFVTHAELERYLWSEPNGEAALDEYMRELGSIKTCPVLAELEDELKCRKTRT